MKNSYIVQKITSVLLLCIASFLTVPAQAAISLELTQGIEAAMPIALIPFKYEGMGQDPSGELMPVIKADLQNSGQFKFIDINDIAKFPHTVAEVNLDYWRQLGVDALVIGRIYSSTPGSYQIDVSLVNAFSGDPRFATQSPLLFSKTFTVTQGNLRQLAHHISDLVYENLTGIRGIFSTRIAYILEQRPAGKPPVYKLEVADADGYNPQALLVSNQPIMSPSWSPDGKQIAYVSFEKRKAQIYLVDVATGRRTLVASYPGINGAPAWSPDGKKLAMVLSKDGHPNIYMLDLDSKQLTQLTRSWSIDTEPSWSPDGDSIVFTSDRGGSPQIYQLDVATRAVKRLTFTGNYNAKPAISADGRQLVMMHREGKQFSVAEQNLTNGRVSTLTRGGYAESPSLAPNGTMVLYATDQDGQGILGMSSTDGRVQLKLPAREGSVREPAWSPFSG